MMGQHESSRVADHLAEAEERLREDEFVRCVRAHESLNEDWTEHHDDRPDGLRPLVWHDPLCEPANPTETEQRFVQTRRIRQRVLHWQGDLS